MFHLHPGCNLKTTICAIMFTVCMCVCMHMCVWEGVGVCVGGGRCMCVGAVRLINQSFFAYLLLCFKEYLFVMLLCYSSICDFTH